MIRLTPVCRFLVLAFPLAGCLLRGQIPVTPGNGGIGDPSQLPGNPSSSYALSGLDHLNYYNGSVNVVIPVMSVGGRGDVTRPIAIPVQRYWGTYQSGSSYAPFSGLSAIITGYYTSGFLTEETTSSSSTYCYNSSTQTVHYNQSTGYIVWTGFDGTQTILTDVKYHGQPLDPSPSCTGADRGTVFQSTDGTNLTFVATADVLDGAARVLGNLIDRNGNKLVFDNSIADPYVHKAEDRNGNLIQLQWSGTDSGGIYTFTDPAGRQPSVNYTEVPSSDAKDVITYLGSNAATRTIIVNYALLDGADASTGLSTLAAGESVETYLSLFPELNGSGSTNFNPYVITSVVLPDGTHYALQYNGYGELARLTLPTGAAYRYRYGEAHGVKNGASGVIALAGGSGFSIYRPLVERDEYPDGSTLSGKLLYSSTPTPSGLDPKFSSRAGIIGTATVESAAGAVLRQESHYFYGNPASTAAPVTGATFTDWWEGLEFRTDVGNGSSVLSSTQKLYGQRPCGASENCTFNPEADNAPAHDPQLCQTNTTLDAHATSGVINAYDSYNNVTDRYEFDFGSTPALGSSCPSTAGLTGYMRHTNTQFLTGAYANASVNLLSLPSQTTVSDSAGKLYSETAYSYDSAGHLFAEGTAIANHDDANFGGSTGLGATRGNLTVLRQCYVAGIPFASASSCAWHNSVYNYDLAGNVLSVIDPVSNKTTFSYADSYADGNNGRNTYAHLTTLTNAKQELQQRQGWTYDFNTGKPTLSYDLNGVETAYVYSDALDRVTQVQYARGQMLAHQANFVYSSNSTEVNTYRDQTSNGDRVMRTQQLYDGFGRLLTSNLYESSTGYISTKWAYDALGQTVASSNPSRPGDGLGYTTSYLYDALGRQTEILHPDGNKITTGYNADANYDYQLRTDESGAITRYWLDGFGRIKEVVEDPSNLGQVTTYTYTALDTLSNVTQGAQTRTFLYDSVGAIVQATNPESGTTKYAYDGDGNLFTKTDGRGFLTNYRYDALNRPVNISYTQSSGATPTTTIAYDNANTPFGTGHVASISNAVATNTFSGYDELGDVTSASQLLGGKLYQFTYSYDVAGELMSEGGPSLYSGAVYYYDNTGLINQIGIDGTTSNITYAPSGVPQTIQYGNGVTRYFSYNSRLQQQEITDVDTVHGYGCGTQPTPYQSPALTKWDLDLQLFWGQNSGQTTKNNGNVWGQKIQTCNGTNLSTAANFSQSYAYDTLNRIQNIQDTGGSSTRTFGYDRYGNMSATNTAGSFPHNLGTPASSSSFDPTTNRLISSLSSYDGAGNQLGMPSVCNNCLQYDAENRLISYTPTGTTYTYDGLGQRVQKIEKGVTTTYLYDVFGRMVSEYTSGTVATLPCNPCYLSADHLGNTRMVTDQNGNVVSRHDFLPFGEEIPGGYAGRPATPFGNADGVDQKFTGQVRDAESGMDFFNARYFAAVLGRFTSPDPGGAGADPMNPQTWNAYSYVWNNPLSATDPTGTDTCSDGTEASVCVNAQAPPDISTIPVDASSYFYVPYVFQTTVYTRPPALPTQPGNPAKNVARSDLLNNITSIFGYDQRIPLPSCFGHFVNNTISNLFPFLPGLSNVSEEGFGVASRVAYNRALGYAASTPSKTFGTSFLKYPFKSSVFRGLLSKSASLAEAAPMAGVVTAEGQALYNEVQSMKQGACQ